jgi:hypothetical protein
MHVAAGLAANKWSALNNVLGVNDFDRRIDSAFLLLA